MLLSCIRLLWFGDERGYNATEAEKMVSELSCGLVMKEDITQQLLPGVPAWEGCGLVMKEDITQRGRASDYLSPVVVW